MYFKLGVFAEELALIQNPDIRAFVEKCILKTPDYFYRVPASSTGKYHPEYSLGDGGLIRHTKALIYIAKELLTLEHYQHKFTSDERDIMIAAGILHDSFKHGDTEQQYSIADHPVVAANHVLEWAEQKEIGFARTIADCIRSHMGEWNTDYKTKKPIMPKPETDMEKFVHECDYLASRKSLIVKFDNYYDPKAYLAKATALIDQVITFCREAIDTASNKEELRAYLYDIISALNYGEKNPFRLRDEQTAIRVLNTLKEYGDEEHMRHTPLDLIC